MQGNNKVILTGMQLGQPPRQASPATPPQEGNYLGLWLDSSVDPEPPLRRRRMCNTDVSIKQKNSPPQRGVCSTGVSTKQENSPPQRGMCSTGVSIKQKNPPPAEGWRVAPGWLPLNGHQGQGVSPHPLVTLLSCSEHFFGFVAGQFLYRVQNAVAMLIFNAGDQAHIVHQRDERSRILFFYVNHAPGVPGTVGY